MFWEHPHHCEGVEMKCLKTYNYEILNFHIEPMATPTIREPVESESASLGFACAASIERRPRGASRINLPLHWLQRATVCQALVVRLWCMAINGARRQRQP